jgi:hypothetical protein
MNAITPPAPPADLAASTPAPVRRAPTLTDRLRPHLQHVLALTIPPAMLIALLMAV